MGFLVDPAPAASPRQGRSRSPWIRILLGFFALMVLALVALFFSVMLDHRGRPHAPKLLATLLVGSEIGDLRDAVGRGKFEGWWLEVVGYESVRGPSLAIEFEDSELGRYRVVPLDDLPGPSERDFSGRVEFINLPAWFGDGEVIELIYIRGRLVKKKWGYLPG